MITPRDRIGLVGANGTGKSTLLKILAGSESLDYGSVSRAKGISAGYLPQDGLALSGRTVFAECMSVFSKLRAMEQEMEELTGRMSELDHASPEYAQVAERYHRLEHEFSTRDGYAIEAQVGAVLSGLGFRKEDWTRQTEEFSGGWQMRIALVKLLLQQPNLLLLDEPTNNLDLEARNWLEEYLGNYPYAFVLISHDRYFLDVTINKIVEIWNKRVHLYHGNYEKYVDAKTQRLEQLESAYRNQRDPVAAFDHETDVAKHFLFTIGLRHSNELGDDPASGFRLREGKVNGLFLFRQFDALDLFQFLDPALHLLGLGRLVAKAVDEDFQLLDALPLVAICRLQLLQALSFCAQIFLVVAVVKINSLIPDFDNLVDRDIEKITVV